MSLTGKAGGRNDFSSAAAAKKKREEREKRDVFSSTVDPQTPVLLEKSAPVYDGQHSSISSAKNSHSH
ncbi:MAG: hypothetical protein AAF633_24795, partial [Chloroflexota bacterium]